GSSADAALVGFEKAVERRIARLRTLNDLVEKRAGAYVWTEAVGTNVDVQRLEQEGRAYVTAAPATGSEAGARRGAGDHGAVVGSRRAADCVPDLVPGVEPEAAARTAVASGRSRT